MNAAGKVADIRRRWCGSPPATGGYDEKQTVLYRRMKKKERLRQAL